MQLKQQQIMCMTTTTTAFVPNKKPISRSLVLDLYLSVFAAKFYRFHSESQKGELINISKSPTAIDIYISNKLTNHKTFLQEDSNKRFFDKSQKEKIKIEVPRGEHKKFAYLPYRSMAMIEQFIYQLIFEDFYLLFKMRTESRESVIRRYFATMDIDENDVDFDNIRRAYDRYKAMKHAGGRRLFLPEQKMIVEINNRQKRLF